jgi:DNA modification methylase
MMIGRFNENTIYNEDCYKAIKDIPSGSIDLVYIDIPYSYTLGGGGGLLRNETRRITYKEKITQFSNDIDFSIFDELVRIMKHIYIYMV